MHVLSPVRSISMSADSHTATVLNDLIETLKDGQEGYLAAAEQVRHPDLKVLLEEYATQRGQFVAELQELDVQSGEPEPPDSGSLAGAVHRGWINVKTHLTENDDHAVLEECERGDEMAINAFEQVLKDESISAVVFETVNRQLTEIKATYDRVKILRYESDR